MGLLHYVRLSVRHLKNLKPVRHLRWTIKHIIKNQNDFMKNILKIKIL